MGALAGPVLVTGGAGFIGSHVARELVDRGHDVAVLDNLHAGRRGLVPEAASLHEVDLRDADAVRSAVDAVAPATVLHLAALHYIPYCDAHVEETVDVNVLGTRHLLEALRDLDGLSSVVFASTAGVYPPHDGACPETMAPGPIDIYGKTKLVGEDLVRLFARETGVPSVAARLFNVYGPDETNPHLVPAIVEQLEAGADEVALGNLAPRRDFVHVDDVVRALLALADAADGYRAYNVGTGEAYAVREVAETAIAVLDREVDVVQAESRVRASDRPHLQADVSRIAEEVGWAPEVAFEDGLRRLLETEGVLAA